mmetsp:Transcript_10639/g.9366  ORF Transcript_10639/g.9366 Transcript_10639/m.9366 type:complete len:86 (-) Transcript_10639:42-299(-)
MTEHIKTRVGKKGTPSINKRKTKSKRRNTVESRRKKKNINQRSGHAVDSDFDYQDSDNEFQHQKNDHKIENGHKNMNRNEMGIKA